MSLLLDATLAGLDHYLDHNQSHPKQDQIRATSRGILRAYVGLYAARDAKDYEVLGVEELLSGPIINPTTQKDTGYMAAGKLDVRVKQCANGKRSIIDHKTRFSPMDSNSRDHLLVDTQPLHYAYLEHLDGERIDSAIWDTLHKTTHRLKKEESLQELEDRIYHMYSETPTDYFARVEFPILTHHLAQYALELYAWTRKLDEAFLLNEHLKSPEGCYAYNRPCRYLQVCAGRMDLLNSLQQGHLVTISNTHPELSLPEGTDQRLVVTNSRLKTFRQCMRKHDLQYNLGLRKPNEITEEPLYVGSVIHAALEAYWRVLQTQSN